MPPDKEQARQQILFDRRTAPIPKNPPPPINRAPTDENHQPICQDCEQRTACCNRDNTTGCRIGVSFESLSHN